MNKNVKGLLKQSFVRNMEHRGGRTFLKLRTKGVSLFLSLSLSLSLSFSLSFSSSKRKWTIRGKGLGKTSEDDKNRGSSRKGQIASGQKDGGVRKTLIAVYSAFCLGKTINNYTFFPTVSSLVVRVYSFRRRLVQILRLAKKILIRERNEIPPTFL